MQEGMEEYKKEICLISALLLLQTALLGRKQRDISSGADGQRIGAPSALGLHKSSPVNYRLGTGDEGSPAALL